MFRSFKIAALANSEIRTLFFLIQILKSSWLVMFQSGWNWFIYDKGFPRRELLFHAYNHDIISITSLVLNVLIYFQTVVQINNSNEYVLFDKWLCSELYSAVAHSFHWFVVATHFKSFQNFALFRFCLEFIESVCSAFKSMLWFGLEIAASLFIVNLLVSSIYFHAKQIWNCRNQVEWINILEPFTGNQWIIKWMELIQSNLKSFKKFPNYVFVFSISEKRRRVAIMLWMSMGKFLLKFPNFISYLILHIWLV